jgi:hypothetical protein
MFSLTAMPAASSAADCTRRPDDSREIDLDIIVPGRDEVVLGRKRPNVGHDCHGLSHFDSLLHRLNRRLSEVSSDVLDPLPGGPSFRSPSTS